jgi:putative ABC transport system permease protein
MKFRDLAQLVWSNLNRMRTRATLSAAGVVVSTAAIVILISLAVGLQRSAAESLSVMGDMNEITLLGGAFRLLRERPSSSDSGRITPKALAELAQRPGVVAVTPRESLLAQAQISLDGVTSFVGVIGIDAQQVRNLSLRAKSGSLALGRQQVLVGAQVEESFVDPRDRKRKIGRVDLQDKMLKLTLTQTSPDGRTDKHTVRLQVAGVLAERGSQDDYSVFLALPDLEDLNTWAIGQRPNPARDGYSRATLVMAAPDQVLPFQQELGDQGFLTYSAKSYLQGINIFFLVVQAFMGGVGVIALVVAGISIANTLTMAIYERTREIGLMKAVGATNRDVMSVFLSEAGSIGALGGLGGITVGWCTSLVINLIAKLYIGAQAVLVGNAGENAAVPNVAFVPLWLPVFVLIFATGIGVLSGVYPAQRAVQLNPVTALKYE